jgi:hypothetical protein
MLSLFFHKMGGTWMSFSGTNSAFCRELIVHVEISLFFFLAAATWELSGKLHWEITYLAAELIMQYIALIQT